MGGPGSTRWRGHTKRGLVEATPRIYLSELARGGAFQDQDTGGTYEWTSGTGQPLASAILLISAPREDRTRDLKIVVTRPDESRYLTKIHLDPVRTRYGGHWWIARCPVSGCSRRAVKLYLDLPGNRIGCRFCLGLTHRTTQQQDKRRDHARRDLHGFLRSRAHLTSLRSQVVTARIEIETIRHLGERTRGRGWGRSETLRDLA